MNDDQITFAEICQKKGWSLIAISNGFEPILQSDSDYYIAAAALGKRKR